MKKLLPYKTGPELYPQTINIRCFICNTTVIAYKWSLAGSGKRCPFCKCIHTSHGTRRPIKSGPSQELFDAAVERYALGK